MKNAIVKPTNMPVREIGVITAEIKDLCRQAQATALLYAVEIGRRLEEAKSTLPYGKWGEWLKEEVEFSQSTANNFMRLFEEYGSSQISIFGASVDSQTFANLPYSKALQLLAIPKEERESFAEEVGAADLSVKELKVAIEERDKARSDAEAARKEAKEAREREEKLADKLAEVESAATQSAVNAEEVSRLKNTLDEMTRSLEESKKNAQMLQDKLNKAEKDPKIPSATLKKMKSDAEEAAKKAAADEANKAIAEISNKLKEVEARKITAELAEKRARERLEEAEKRLKTAAPEVTAFKALFEQMQKIAIELKSKIATIGENDADTANKLSNALKAFGANLQQKS